MHRWVLLNVKGLHHGTLERCLVCKGARLSTHREPSWHYLQAHLRSALQREDPRFKKEYNKQ